MVSCAPLLSAHRLDPPLIRILSNSLEEEDPQGNYAQSPKNAACVISICLQALSSLKKESAKEIDIRRIVEKCSRGWYWHAGVMRGLDDLVSSL